MPNKHAQRGSAVKVAEVASKQTGHKGSTLAKGEIIGALEKANRASEKLEKEMRVDPKIYHEPVTF